MIFDYGAAHELSVSYSFKNQLVSKRGGSRHGKALCFTAMDGHCFLIKSAAWAQKQREGVLPTVARRVDTEVVDKTPDITSWEVWGGELKEGRFWTTEDLHVLRQEFFAQGIVPKVSLTGKTHGDQEAYHSQDDHPAGTRGVEAAPSLYGQIWSGL